MPAPIGPLHSSPIITRHPANPLLTAQDVPYPSGLAYNGSVVKFQGRYVMLFRNDFGPFNGNRLEKSNVGLAESDDGVRWQVRPRPAIDWQGGDVLAAMDPRVQVVEGRCYVTLGVTTKHGLRGYTLVTDDFEQYATVSITVPDNRDLVLFPEKVGGRYVRLERPLARFGLPEDRYDIWVSESPDLTYWGRSEVLLAADQVPFANARIGPSAPPLKTPAGWLVVFHAVDDDPARGKNGWEDAWTKRYTAGVMLLDLQDPRKIIGLARQPLLVPEAPYEVSGGYRNGIVFPCAAVLEDTGEVKVYYGAADTVQCLATAPLADLLRLCRQQGNRYFS